MTLDDFANYINVFMGERNPDLRLGQYAFIVLEEEFPDIANLIRGTKLDPFYNDENIQKFLIYLLLLTLAKT
jgi:hypothetical protein